MCTPEYGRIIERVGDMILVVRLDQWGKDATTPPRWYTVQLKGKPRSVAAPDWTTVQYHTYLNEAERRLGLTEWVHPDLRASPG